MKTISMNKPINEKRSRVLAKFQSKAPEQHQLFLNLLVQAAEKKQEEKEEEDSKRREVNRRWEESNRQER